MMFKHGERIFELMTKIKCQQLIKEMVIDKIKYMSAELTLMRKKIRRMEEAIHANGIGKQVF